MLDELARVRAASRPVRKSTRRAGPTRREQGRSVVKKPVLSPAERRERRAASRRGRKRVVLAVSRPSNPQRGGAKVALNHEQRRERRRNMALQVTDGKSIDDVAAEFGVTPATVRLACKEFRVIFRLSREQRRLRRVQMASAIAEGQSVGQVCETFRVSAGYVVGACREHKVRIPGRRRGRPPQLGAFQILGWLFAHPSRSQSDAARHFGVTRQRIEQITRAAVAAGIPLPQRQA